MQQGNLFDLGHPDMPPAQRHSETSVAAAVEVKPEAAKLRAVVLEFIQSRGEHGVTDEEGIAWTGLNPSTYRPRRIECVEAGQVVDSGTTRKTKSGRAAVVWIHRGFKGVASGG